MVKGGSYVPADARERLLEIEKLIEELKPERPMLFDTTHPSNIVKIKGTLPEDREKLLAEIEI